VSSPPIQESIIIKGGGYLLRAPFSSEGLSQVKSLVDILSNKLPVARATPTIPPTKLAGHRRSRGLQTNKALVKWVETKGSCYKWHPPESPKAKAVA
jgi:hypothetical protein